MSSRQFLVRGTKTIDDLMLVLGQRSYGAYMEPAERLLQGIPDFLRPFAVELRGRSALLKLDVSPSIDHDAIYDAYQADVKLLQGRLDGFEKMISSAVTASLKPGLKAEPPSYQYGDEPEYRERTAKRSDWETIKANMPQMQNIPLIDLSAERASLPADQLIIELKAEVEAGIERLLRRVCFWLDELVDREYIGLVHFTAPTVGHYYYFRPSVSEEVVKKGTQIDISEDTDQPFGSRITYKTTDSRTTKVTENLERHDHHIVRARVDLLDDFQQMIPDRILENLLNETPAWLRPHLRVVSGDITKEAIHRRIVREHEEHEEIVSVWKGSPAIAFGDYVLSGWSSDDIAKEPSSFWRGRRITTAEERELQRSRTKGWVTAGSIIVALSLAALGMTQCTINENRETVANYAHYQRLHTAGHQVYTAKVNQKMLLPQGQPFYYLGMGSYGPSGNSAVISTDAASAWQNGNRHSIDLRQMQNGPDSLTYGKVDLSPDFGVPAMMNILSIDKDKITFTIDYQGDFAKTGASSLAGKH